MKSIAYIPGSNGAGNASQMTVQTLRSPGASDILVNTVTGVPAKFYGSMGAPHTFTDPVTAETITIISEATAVDFAGHIDTGKIVIDAIAPGYVDTRGSLVGDIVVVRPVTEWANNLFNVLDQSHNDDGTIKESAITYEPTVSNFIQTGGVWSIASGLSGAMTALSSAYITGRKNTNTIAALASRAFTASKDTYVDVLRNTTTGAISLVYTEVTNGAASPALAANSLRAAKVVTSGAAITLIQQYAADSLNNVIYPTAPIQNANLSILSVIPPFTDGAATGNFTAPTAVVNTNITIPAGCSRLLVMGKVRVQAQTASATDMSGYIDYDNGVTATATNPGAQSSPIPSVVTGVGTFAGGMLPFWEIFNVIPGVHPIRIVLSSNLAMNAAYKQLVFIPLAG